MRWWFVLVVAVVVDVVLQLWFSNEVFKTVKVFLAPVIFGGVIGCCGRPGGSEHCSSVGLITPLKWPILPTPPLPPHTPPNPLSRSPKVIESWQAVCSNAGLPQGGRFPDFFPLLQAAYKVGSLEKRTVSIFLEVYPSSFFIYRMFFPSSTSKYSKSWPRKPVESYMKEIGWGRKTLKLGLETGTECWSLGQGPLVSGEPLKLNSCCHCQLSTFLPD